MEVSGPRLWCIASHAACPKSPPASHSASCGDHCDPPPAVSGGGVPLQQRGSVEVHRDLGDAVPRGRYGDMNGAWTMGGVPPRPPATS
jgi:hypothetical protein